MGTELDRSAEERALAAVTRVREARAAIVSSVADGSRSPAEVLREPGEVGGGIRVLTLVEAAPGAAKVASRRLLAEVGIDELATVAEAGSRAVVLADALDRAAEAVSS